VFVCRNVIGLVNRDFHNGELEPLTGLLTRDAFTDRVATPSPRATVTMTASWQSSSSASTAHC
jgi:hypothetical protein